MVKFEDFGIEKLTVAEGEIYTVSGTLIAGANSHGKTHSMYIQERKSYAPIVANEYNMMKDWTNGLNDKTEDFSYDWTITSGQAGEHSEFYFVFSGNKTTDDGDTFSLSIKNLKITKK